MVYNATSLRAVQTFLLVLVLFLVLQSAGLPWLLYTTIPIAIVMFITIFITYTVKIDEGIMFQVRVFGFTIYNKEVHYKQISSIQFINPGWNKKCAIVRKQKGFHFRILNFKPETIFSDIEDFAKQYKIPVMKTKEYQILENK